MNGQKYNPPPLFVDQRLFAKNGETVIVKRINDDQSIIVEYKGKYYSRNIASCYNITLFPAPYNSETHYYNVYGYDEAGYDVNGYDPRGFDKDGYDRYGFDPTGRDRDGYDREGFNKRGFTKQGLFWTDVAMQQLAPEERKIIFGNLCSNSGIVKKCKDCGKEYQITFDEYKWFEKKGLHTPKRCKTCRNKNNENGIYEGLRESMRRDDISIVRTGREQAYSNYLEYDI